MRGHKVHFFIHADARLSDSFSLPVRYASMYATLILSGPPEELNQVSDEHSISAQWSKTVWFCPDLLTSCREVAPEHNNNQL
jgi:hypothetical protein